MNSYLDFTVILPTNYQHQVLVTPHAESRIVMLHMPGYRGEIGFDLHFRQEHIPLVRDLLTALENLPEFSAVEVKP